MTTFVIRVTYSLTYDPLIHLNNGKYVSSFGKSITFCNDLQDALKFDKKELACIYLGVVVGKIASLGDLAKTVITGELKVGSKKQSDIPGYISGNVMVVSQADHDPLLWKIDHPSAGAVSVPI